MKSTGGSIRLHRKYGVAPALGLCPICRHNNGEVLLLGASCDKIMREATGEDYKEYGRNELLRPEPCDDCKAHLDAGAIAFISDTGDSLMVGGETAQALVEQVIVDMPEVKVGRYYKAEPEAIAKLREILGITLDHSYRDAATP